MSPFKINLFLLFKLPSAFFSGVRLKSITNNSCLTSVKYKWINQNPFNSMYFAVQAMCAELSTGTLVLKKIKESNKKISMLVVENNSKFYKKATGRINFICENGLLIDDKIKEAIETKEGKTFSLTSIGKNKNNEKVSEFEFIWSIKVKS